MDAEPVHLDAHLKAVLLHAVSRWLDELPFAAWPAGLYESSKQARAGARSSRLIR